MSSMGGSGQWPGTNQPPFNNNNNPNPNDGLDPAAANTSEAPPDLRRVPISRLGAGNQPPYHRPQRYHRQHVGRACEQCRQKKTKCTGEKASCGNCRESQVECIYTAGKREQSKMQLADLNKKVEDYDKAFKQLSADQGVPQEELLSGLIRKYDAIADEERRGGNKIRKLDETATVHAVEAQHEELQDNVKCAELLEEYEADFSSATTGNLPVTPSSSIPMTQVSSDLPELPSDLQLVLPDGTQLQETYPTGVDHAVLAFTGYYLEDLAATFDADSFCELDGC